MNIVIKNCNNIDSGTVTLEENILNLKSIILTTPYIYIIQLIVIKFN